LADGFFLKASFSYRGEWSIPCPRSSLLFFLQTHRSFLRLGVFFIWTSELLLFFFSLRFFFTSRGSFPLGIYLPKHHPTNNTNPMRWLIYWYSSRTVFLCPIAARSFSSFPMSPCFNSDSSSSPNLFVFFLCANWIPETQGF